jgi:hypothetical protein
VDNASIEGKVITTLEGNLVWVKLIREEISGHDFV